MVTVLLGLNFLLMILLPIILGRMIAARYPVKWGLLGIGAVTFILSQTAHLPFNWLVLQKYEWVTPENLIVYSVFLGLSAGSFEGIARYLAFRFWAKDARSWSQGLMVGLGHGGIEAILVGSLGIINFVILLGLKDGHFQGIVASLTAEQLPLVDAQINALFSVPPPLAVYGALERLFSLLLHLSASILVLQAFVRGQLRWLGAGVLWHAVTDGGLVYVFVNSGGVMAETVLGLMSFVSLGIIFWLRTPESDTTDLPPLPELRPLAPLNISGESLDRSKYSG